MSEFSLLRRHREEISIVMLRGINETVPMPDLEEKIGRFLDFLEQSVTPGEPSSPIDFLDSFSVESCATTSNDHQAALARIIALLSTGFTSTVASRLPATDAMKLISYYQPRITELMTKACDHELASRLNFLSNQLASMTQSLRRLEQTKSDFIAVAAHELRTPLTLIEGYISMLDDRIQNSYPDFPNREYISGIQNGARRMRATIDDMIDVSIIDNNMLQLNIQPLWIDRILGSLVLEFHSISHDRQISISIDDLVLVNRANYGDPERLMQVFRNILTNAIKYTPDGGSITIRALEHRQFIEIIIQDTGIGIDPEDQAVIFEKFGQVSNPALHSSSKTKFKGGGAGLGLYIARGIIEAHGGAIWVDSEGRDEIKLPGSIFHVMLPIRTTPPDEKMAVMFKDLPSEKRTD